MLIIIVVVRIQIQQPIKRHPMEKNNIILNDKIHYLRNGR